MILRKAIHEAADPTKGATLGEMAQFVQEALRADLPHDTPLRAAVGWRGQIQRIGTGTQRP